MAFNVRKNLIKVQGGRLYLPVAKRLVWFRESHPDWGIETKPVELNTEKGYAVFEASVFNENGKLMAKGTKMENQKDFKDYIEKAETGAIGRALAVCGFGTQFAPDLNEGGVVDSPQAITDDEEDEPVVNPQTKPATVDRNLHCASCGAGITISQHDFSLAKFKAPMCPACQKHKPTP